MSQQVQTIVILQSDNGNPISAAVENAQRSPDHRPSGGGQDLKSVPPGPHGSSVDDFLARQKIRVAHNPMIVKLQEAKRTTSDPAGYLKRLFVIFTTSASFTLILAFILSIPLSKIIVGVLFYSECPAEPFITPYLVIGGIVACVRDVASLCVHVILGEKVQAKHETFFSVFSAVYSTCEFAWFVGGSVYVYKAWDAYQYVDKTQANYCNVLLYMYAFVLTTVSYVMLVAVMCMMCLAVCIAKFLDDDGDQEDMQTITVVAIV